MLYLERKLRFKALIWRKVHFCAISNTVDILTEKPSPIFNGSDSISLFYKLRTIWSFCLFLPVLLSENWRAPLGAALQSDRAELERRSKSLLWAADTCREPLQLEGAELELHSGNYFGTSFSAPLQNFTMSGYLSAASDLLGAYNLYLCAFEVRKTPKLKNQMPNTWLLFVSPQIGQVA